VPKHRSPSRRQFLHAAAGALLAPALVRAAETLPTTGRADPRLSSFDELMTGFVAEHKMPGAALAVTRHGKLVYARGFGYANVEKKEPVRPASLFRIASLSKPLTAVAILQLMDRKKLKLDDPILDHVKLTPHLDAGEKPDPRWRRITVRHCLHHTGGWDRDKSFDPIGVPWKIAAALKTQPPVPAEDVVRYMMGQPLDFDPGERFAYSNLGYLLLGRAIESASGMKYEEYVRREVLAPLGVRRMRLGRALPEYRAKDEVAYYDAKPKQRGRCLYPPRRGKQVPIPDGAVNFEGFEAHGGWIASAVDLVRFASAFDEPKKCPILSAHAIETMWERPAKLEPKPVYYGCGWDVRPMRGGQANTWHTGYITGSSTLLVRRFDGLNWAVLFNTNKDADGKTPAQVIDGPMHKAADRVRQWP
jgi:N-acyl-D-amino-acid deacylase